MPGPRDLSVPAGVASPYLYARSDADVLARVLVHRPGDELACVTAHTAAEFLFDGPVDLDRAQRDHDLLVEAVSSCGAQVEVLETVLCGALADRALGESLVEGLGARDDAAAWLRELPPARLARVLIAGLTEAELAGREPGRWLVRPLPNLLFTRDLFSVLGAGIARGKMRRLARSGEGRVADAVLDALGARTWWARGDVGVEGGDVLLAGDGVVVIGIGERTSRAGAGLLARRLLDAGVAREVLGAVMPPDGPFHLDLALSVVHEGVLLADRAVVDATATIRWRPNRPPASGGDLIGAIGQALGAAPKVIDTLPESNQHAWDRGANVVALEPGTVVAYAENRATNRRLQRAGIDVLPVPGAALGLGRGGPRCLTAPLVRSPAAGGPPAPEVGSHPPP